MIGLHNKDIDLRINDLQYRNSFEYASGHGVATKAYEKNGKCNEIETVWIPEAEIEKVVPNESIPNLNLSMQQLGEVESFDKLKPMLLGFITEYDKWIQDQKNNHGVTEKANRSCRSTSK